MQKPTCLQLKVHLAEIQSLFREFDLELGKVRETRQTEGLLKMQKEIEEKIEKLQKEFIPKEIREKIKDWQNFYREVFQMEIDFSHIKIPKKQEGFERLIIMQKGLTVQRLFDKCAELFPTKNWMEGNLDEIVTSDRNASQRAYAIWVRENVEADKELKNLSANDIAEKGITAETLEERLLDEIKYFKQTGKHLDIANVTLCTGSRLSDSIVPSVGWSIDRLDAGSYGPDDRSDGLRARQVVSSSPKADK